MDIKYLVVLLGLLPKLILGDGMPPEREPADSELADYIATSLSRRRHDEGSISGGLLETCGYDTNRLCRIAQDVYMRYADWRVRLTALTIIGECGDAQQVPFLDACVTDFRNGPNAILILNRLEGFTSNSVMRTARYHSVTNQEVLHTDSRAFSDRGFALERLAYCATRPTVSADLKDFTRDYIFSFASNNLYHVLKADRALMTLDPTFKNSKRRLALLRYAQPRVSGTISLQRIAEEIQELESYPEASLPE